MLLIFTLFRKLENHSFPVLLQDTIGEAHPRSCNIACQIIVWLDTPSPGVNVKKKEGLLYLLFGGIIAAVAAAGIAHEGLLPLLTRFFSIQVHPGRLLSDYTVIGSAGSALFNAALVGAIGLLLTFITRIRLSGPTIAAIFTLMGFGLFGKTPLNVIPIMFGVFLSAKIAGKTFKEYILIALFGSALGPVVSFIIFGSGLTGLPSVFMGVGAGIAAGILLPPLAIAMLKLHQGYNLYNIGLTSGFFALFAAGIIAASGGKLDLTLIWNTEPIPLLTWFVPVVSLILLVCGIAADKKASFRNWIKLCRQSGRLPSDFMDIVSRGSSLINMGIMGFISWGYVVLVGGDLNGPVLGGILTVIGFASFGKHPRNALPVMAGAVAATLLFGKSLSAPGPLLAFLFCTTLSPLAGDFGIHVGFISGFIHLVLVERTAPWHGGMDLYNNGFAGGLTAALLVAIIEWIKANRKQVSWFSGREERKKRKRGDHE